MTEVSEYNKRTYGLKYDGYKPIPVTGDSMKVTAITRTVADSSNIEFLQEIDLPMPVAIGHDLLAEVKAISVNPVDTKVREGSNVDMPHVLGRDAVGVVKSVGEAVTLSAPGDEARYAGTFSRVGSSDGSQPADERITALKPKTLNSISAVTLPLTAITVWEMLFDRLGTEGNGNEDDVLLIVGTIGGVGSILTQLASRLTKMTAIGTVSHPQSQEWVREADAYHVIDHSKPLTEELARIGIKGVTRVASLNNTGQRYSQIIAILAPQDKLTLIDGPQLLGVRSLKAKSISLHWEFMFTRSMFTTHDIIAQHQLLTYVAQLIDDSTLRTTLGEHFGAITVVDVQGVCTRVEAGRSIDRIVLGGF